MKRGDRQSKNSDKQFRCKHFILLSVSIISLLFLAATEIKAAESAADYPSRPIEWVTHNSAGDTGDILGRFIGDIFEKENILKQPLVVVNKVGSGGAVAYGYVYEKKGSPYTTLAVTSGNFILTPVLRKLPFNYKAFKPICNLLLDGNVLVVKADSPFKTIDDIIAEARKRPKQLIQGGGSLTSTGALMRRQIQKLKGVEWNIISFTSESEIMLNVLSGNIHFAFSEPSSVYDNVRAGKLRVILTGAPKRWEEFPNAPTLEEAGLGEPILFYRGLAGPPDMPDYAVKKLESAFKKVTESDRFKKQIKSNLQMISWMSTDEYSKFLDKLNDRWMKAMVEFDLK